MTQAKLLMTSFFLASLTAPAFAGEWATRDEAQVMVKKAVAYLKVEGADQGLPGIHQEDPRVHQP